MTDTPTLADVRHAAAKIHAVLKPTPLQYSERLSDKYSAKIYVKREDMQPVRSYKIRGAYNSVSNLTHEQQSSGVVCASAGNHAQGVAWACARAGITATIFMPEATPLQKVNRVRHFGADYATIHLTGSTYDEAAEAAQMYATSSGASFIHPFNDSLTIAGQGSVMLEIEDQLPDTIDAIVVPVGGGGLLAGTVTVVQGYDNSIKLYGAEPEFAASMAAAKTAGKPITLPHIDTFVDGAAVRTVGERSYNIIVAANVDFVAVSTGRLCQEMIDLYQNDGIITEPAGALSIAALDAISADIIGKTVVCVVSGGNNDISRYPEIVERSLIHQGLKHYFLVEFSQRPGQLRAFLDDALGPNDDIVRFEYTKKNNKESGPALVGIELSRKEDLQPLLKRLTKIGIKNHQVIDDELLYDFLV